MEWISALSRLGIAFPLLAIVIMAFVSLVGVAAMAAIWHPDPRRRSSAYKVLELLLETPRRADRRRRQQRPGTRGIAPGSGSE